MMTFRDQHMSTGYSVETVSDYVGTCTCAHCSLLSSGAGLSLWGQGNFLSLLPVLNWTAMQPAQRVSDPEDVHRPGPFPPSPPLKVTNQRGLGGTMSMCSLELFMLLVNR